MTPATLYRPHVESWRQHAEEDRTRRMSTIEAFNAAQDAERREVNTRAIMFLVSIGIVALFVVVRVLR